MQSLLPRKDWIGRGRFSNQNQRGISSEDQFQAERQTAPPIKETN